MSTLISPSKSLASSTCIPAGYFWIKTTSASRASEFPFLSQLRRCLKFGETDVGSRRRSDFSTLLFFHCDFFFVETVVTEPGGAAEDDQRQQQYEEPLHGWQSRIANPSVAGVLL